MASRNNDAHDLPDTADGTLAATATAPRPDDPPAASSPLTRLGFAPGHVVQELGDDDDVDDALRDQLAELTGTELVDGDYGDVVDACIVWFREDDDDLTDTVVDALTDLEDQGFVLLLTPKSGRPGHVEPSEVAEAATTAGLHVSGTLTTCPNWVGTRLVPPKSARR